jgi:protein NrfC
MSKKTDKEDNSVVTVSRRDFFKFSGMAIIGSGIIGCNIFPIGDRKVTWGFLLVDMKKCQGCLSCMLACSLVHDGIESLSLSRIQVLQNSFGKWPNDLTLIQCRQCVEPACVVACPVGALKPDPAFGGVTTVDIEKCIGCKSCVEACPYTPSRIIWNFKEEHSQKCDLCANAPFWDNDGGPDGKKACVEICPLDAIVFTKVIPEQEGEEGYNVNLRGSQWRKLGFPRS